MSNVSSDSLLAGSHKLSNAKLTIRKIIGPESNYLDLEFVVTSYFEAAGLEYVIEKPRPEEPDSTWSSNNKVICSLITQAVDSDNLQYIREHRRHAHGMWRALDRAYQDQTTGGRVYWLQKLLLTKMEGDDILAHIDSMACYHERLNLLISLENPLTADDVHVAALLSSIPQDWLHCVSLFMNQDNVKSETIVTYLKNKCTRRQSQNDVKFSTSSAKTDSSKKQPSAADKPSQHCYFCNRDGHDLNTCHNTRQIFTELKPSQTPTSDPQRFKKPQKNKKSTARAGQTTATNVISSSDRPVEEIQSDYSGYELEIAVGHAEALELCQTARQP